MTARGNRPTDGITIRPMGGLGNQLFGYACGNATAARLNCPLYVDIGAFTNQPAGETARSFELGWLIEVGQVQESSPVLPRSRLLRAARRRLPLLAPPDQFTERSFAYDERIESIRPGTTLNGYFQSWRYFDSIADELRSRIAATAPRSTWFDSQRGDLVEQGPWTAIHVRRGDYALAKNAKYHGLLGPNYYRTALATLRDNGVDGRVVVFSDDVDAARQLLGVDSTNAHFVDPPTGTHPVESIRLMAGANAIITANSSFSWWGAWLADPTSTTVIAPDPWFTGAGYDERDLCPPQWVRLPISRST